MNTKYSALILSLILFGCGGGGGGSSEPNSAPKPPEKLERTALSVQDLSLTFSENGIAYPQVHHQVGETEFSISAGEPNDVITIDPNSGVISILAVGETEVTVVDSSREYKTSSATFNVVVDKAKNTELELSDINISTVTNGDIFLPFSGNKGEIEVNFQPEGLVRFIPESGTIVAEGVPGTVEVTLTDLGNRNYFETTKSAKINIEAIEPDVLDFSSIIRSFQTGLSFNPVKISGSEDGYFHYELADEDKSNPVITLNEDTGLMTALRVGDATVKATQYFGSEYGYATEEASFKVRVEVGKRPNLTVSDANIFFDSEKLFTPAVNNSVAPVHYEVLTGNDAIEVDEQTGLLRILKVGHAEVKVVDDINKNFAADERLFSVNVNPAVHPGIKDSVVTYTFAEDMKVTPSMKGQLGKLSFSGNSNVVSLNDNQLSILRAGTANLSVIDDGGENYQSSSPAFLTVNVLKARHPDFTVSSLTTTYAPDLCLDTNFTGNMGRITLLPATDGDRKIVEYDVSKHCFKILKSGVANFTAVVEESENYLASVPKKMSVVVNAADSSLIVKGDLVSTFSEGNPILSSPKISGVVGDLTYKILDDKSENDVISINSSSGEMTVHNAGHAVVEVTDSGDDKYKPTKTSFSVTIDKAANPVKVDYSDAVYSPDGVITPVIENLKGDISFKVNYPNTSPVTLIEGGILSIQSTGEFSISFEAADSRNYLPAFGNVDGVIHKAEHPGYELQNESFEYAPLKKVFADLPLSYGTRTYSLEGVNGGWFGKYLQVQPGSGEISLFDYAPKKNFTLWVSEKSNELYKELKPQPVRFINIKPPEKGKATRDLTISESFVTLESSVKNSDDKFDSSKIKLVGATIEAETYEEIRQYGHGLILSVDVVSSEPLGNSGTKITRSVRLLVQRYEGCASEVNESNLPNLIEQKHAVGLLNGKPCEEGPTNLILTYKIIDKSSINQFAFYDGEWQTVQPFVVYRSASMKSEETGFNEEKLVEWDRIELILTRD